MEQDKLQTIDNCDASVIRGGGSEEAIGLKGKYIAKCFDAEGNLKWEDEIENLVTTVGKNYALDTVLAGSGFTAVGPFIGLISSVSYTAVAVGDTMASHTGWTEAGITNAPTYSGGRKTTAAGWSAASAGAKALSSALAFTMTGAGTVKGCFLVTGTGAVSTVDNTSGTLFSAGLFTGGDKVVANTDVINVSYSLAA